MVELNPWSLRRSWGRDASCQPVPFFGGLVLQELPVLQPGGSGVGPVASDRRVGHSGHVFPVKINVEVGGKKYQEMHGRRSLIPEGPCKKDGAPNDQWKTNTVFRVGGVAEFFRSMRSQRALDTHRSWRRVIRCRSSNGNIATLERLPISGGPFLSCTAAQAELFNGNCHI